MGQASTGQARIVSVQKAVPPQYIGQDEVIESVLGDLYGGDLIGLAELFSRSQVRKRHYVWDPRKVLAGSMPMIGDRMRAWERHVLELGEDLVRQSLAGLDPDRIGTFVMVSSTGYTNPGPEVTLAKQFGLRPDLRRTFIGHMGCYAAFNGIKVALDAVAARPAELALVGCVELSSLHMHDEATIEQAVVHSLFGDAGGMVLISAAPDAVGPAIIGTHTETHYASSDAMTLRIHDESFRMTLSPTVPHLLARAIGPFLERLLAPAGLTAADVRAGRKSSIWWAGCSSWTTPSSGRPGRSWPTTATARRRRFSLSCTRSCRSPGPDPESTEYSSRSVRG